MRGFVVIIVAAMSMIFLKKKQYIHHFVSLGVIFIGVFLVGLSSIVNPDDGGDSGAA